jgi:hypothetical protein
MHTDGGINQTDTSSLVHTGGGSNQGQGKTEWTEVDGSPGKLKWRIYPIPSRGGEREDFLGPFLAGEIPAFLSLSISTINIC